MIYASSSLLKMMLMFKIRNMKIEDVESVARMLALDHENDLEKGYREAREHTLNHLEIVHQHCLK